MLQEKLVSQAGRRSCTLRISKTRREWSNISKIERLRLYILGIHIGHDSSASLIKDGKIVADVQEERFTRIKHYCGIPFKSLQYVLESQNITIEDIEAVAVPNVSPVPPLNFLLDLKNGRREKSKSDSLLYQLAYRAIGKRTFIVSLLNTLFNTNYRFAS